MAGAATNAGTAAAAQSQADDAQVDTDTADTQQADSQAATETAGASSFTISRVDSGTKPAIAIDSSAQALIAYMLERMHRGTSLLVVDSLQTTWSTWRNLHPQTLILDERVRNDSYASYYRNNDSGVHGDFSDDDRLPAKEIVVGLIIGRTARAYPLALAEHYPVVNDRLDETPVVVAFGSDGQTRIVFDPRLDGRTLIFDPHPSDPAPWSIGRRTASGSD